MPSSSTHSGEQNVLEMRPRNVKTCMLLIILITKPRELPITIDNNSSKDGVRKVECHKVTIPSIVKESR